MRRRLLIVGLTSSLLAAAAVAPAAAQDPVAGCKENGQAVAGVAQAPGAFGQFVRTQTPINDNVAAFKADLCD